MATRTEYTFTTAFYPPLHLTLSTEKPTAPTTTQLYPTPSNPNPPTNNPVFTDAMHIRDAVFVREQHCRAEEEIDDDDARSWGWVVYAHHHQHGGDDGGKEAVGTIRLVPPPQIHHSHLAGDSNSHITASASASASTTATGEEEKTKYDLQHEPYIKITRVAVLARFRGYGLSRLLMQTVEEWAARNKGVIDQIYTQFALDHGIDAPRGWNGLIGLHAQVQVERMYAAMGYETDESMGRWDEEGIEHVGMFKRVAVALE